MKRLFDFMIEVITFVMMVIVIAGMAYLCNCIYNATEDDREDRKEFHQEFSNYLEWYGHEGREAANAFENHECVNGTYKTLTKKYTFSGYDEAELAELISGNPFGRLEIDDSEFSITQFIWECGL